jgi:SAM domain (Sterile alpha motif)
MQQVTDWLEKLGLGQYAQRFAENDIDFAATLRSLSGIVRPSALAVLRLITSSNVVGCSIGKSLGFALLKILSTYEAERRMIQSMGAPSLRRASVPVPVSGPGSVTAIRTRAMHLTGFDCSPEARPTPTFRRSHVWSPYRKQLTNRLGVSRPSGLCWRDVRHSKTSMQRVGSIRH